ncbi:alpha/beta hydrolase [Thetidibacter halocola]|uniref:Alpha/beta fold hydrolase n=1 Tax=Thetidibacter halocola TaxID=2827239 RepID=A0A8J7WFL6_9RHOB|nr:alpha/beta hydrolase [Thetidibacter halocola]MBS0124481.1 alpha/beta fold hydrolase [Thetidibacter halocola]
MVAALLLGTVGTALPAPLAAQERTALREVPFLTLRDRTDSEDPGEAFGDERSDLKAGWCGVREVDLDVFTPLAEAVPAFVREELLRVAALRLASPAAVIASIEETANGRPAVLYTHGFNIGFEKGCRRAVLLQENAGLAGRFLWFSWPSDGALTNYTRDEADLYWSVPDLAEAIIALEARFGPGQVDVTGHSLGARGVVLALYEVANRRPETRIREVVLLAPDMDFEIFQRFLPRIQSVVGRITVYVTEGDRPLALSAQLHGYPRLGEAGNDVSQLTGVEVIDLSDVPAQSPTGHLYHIYSPDLGADLGQLLNEGKGAADRDNLRRIGENHWTLQPRPSAN